MQGLSKHGACLGRILVGLMFLYVGIEHAVNFDMFKGMTTGMFGGNEMVGMVMGILAIIFAILGGLMLIAGFKTKIGALLAGLFMVGTFILGFQSGSMGFTTWGGGHALVMHLAYIGALLYIASMGAGCCSIDNKK